MTNKKDSAQTVATALTAADYFRIVKDKTGTPLTQIVGYSTLQTALVGANDGWITSSYTWTYASASTFTIAGVDLTATFTKGTRLKFTQTTVKYAVVISSSFSTNTTVTIAVNSDYTIANAAISGNYYSYVLNPQGYPHYFNFVPTVTGFSSNPTTIICRYKIDSNTCHFVFNPGAAGTSNSTAFTVTSPVTSLNVSNYYAYNTIGFTRDNGANIAAGSVFSTFNSNILTLTLSGAANWTASGSKNANFVLDIEF